MSKKLSLRNNMIIFGIGIFFTKIVSFIFAPLYSNYLTIEEFGIVDVLTTTATLLIPIFTLAITEGVLKYGIDDNSDLKKVFSTGTVVTILGMGLMTAFVFIAGRYVYKDYAWSAALFFISECIFLFLQAFARAKKNTIAFVVSSVLYSIFSTLFIILFIVVKSFGINGYMVGMSIGTLIGSAFLFVWLKSWKYFSFKSIDKRTVGTMIKYSAPLALSNVSYWVLSGSDKYITKIVLGDEYNGYLSVVHKIPTICTFIFTIFNYAYGMSALKDHKLSEETMDEDNAFYSKLFEYIVLTLVVGLLLVLFLSMPVVSLYSSAYFECWRYVPLYTFGVVIGTFAPFYSYIYCVKEKTFKVMLVILAGAVINALTCYLLMKYTDIKLLATAISTILGNLFIFVFYYFDSFKYAKVRINWKEITGLLACLGLSIMPVFNVIPLYVYYPTVSAVSIYVVLINIKTIKGLVIDVLKRNK